MSQPRHDRQCGFRCDWSSGSSRKWSAIPVVGSGPFLEHRNSRPLAGMLDHITTTVDHITGIGQAYESWRRLSNEACDPLSRKGDHVPGKSSTVRQIREKLRPIPIEDCVRLGKARDRLGRKALEGDLGQGGPLRVRQPEPA